MKILLLLLLFSIGILICSCEIESHELNDPQVITAQDLAEKLNLAFANQTLSANLRGETEECGCQVTVDNVVINTAPTAVEYYWGLNTSNTTHGDLDCPGGCLAFNGTNYSSNYCPSPFHSGSGCSHYVNGDPILGYPEMNIAQSYPFGCNVPTNSYVPVWTYFLGYNPENCFLNPTDEFDVDITYTLTCYNTERVCEEPDGSLTETINISYTSLVSGEFFNEEYYFLGGDCGCTPTTFSIGPPNK